MSKTVKTLLALICIAIIGAAVTYGLYLAGVISFGGGEDDTKTYGISYELTGVKADASNATSIKADGSETLTFTKNDSGAELLNLSADGATILYSRDTDEQVLVVITAPTSSVTITVEAEDDGIDDEDGTYTVTYDVVTASTFDYDLDFDCVTSAEEGEQITFTVNVTGDGQLYDIVIECADGSETGYTSLGDGEYTLVMPAQNIVIYLFIEKVSDDEGTAAVYTVTCENRDYIQYFSPGNLVWFVGSIEEGEEKTFSITAYSDYIIYSVGIDGATLVSHSTYGARTVTVTILAGDSNVTLTPLVMDASSVGDYSIDYDVLTSSSFDYDITVDIAARANEGDTVTFTITVTGDGELHNIVIESDDDGSELDYTSLGDGEYSFEMPASGVFITIYVTESDSSDDGSSSTGTTGEGGYTGGGYGGGGGTGR